MSPGIAIPFITQPGTLNTINNLGEVLMKKILAVLLVAVMAFSLIACASGPAPSPSAPTGNNDTPAADTPSDEPAAEPPAGGDQATISFWQYNYGDAEMFAAATDMLVKQFMEEYPNIKVEWQMAPWDGWLQNIQTAVATKSAPDVTISQGTISAQFHKQGQVLLLDPIVEAWRAEDNPILNDFYPPGALEMYMYQGTHPALPLLFGGRGFMYRTDVFEELGLEEPDNWDEWLDVLRTIKAETDFTPLAIPCHPQDGSHFCMQLMYSNNIGTIHADWSVNYDVPEFRDVLDIVQILWDEKLIPEGTASYTMADALTLYYQGAAAMVFCMPFNLAEDNPEIFEKSGVLRTFAGPRGERRGWMGTDGMMCFNQGNYHEEALTFMKWYYENNLPLFTEGGTPFMPMQYTQLQDPFFNQKKYADNIEKVVPYMQGPTWPLDMEFYQVIKVDGERLLGKYILEGTFEGMSQDDIISNLTRAVKDVIED